MAISIKHRFLQRLEPSADFEFINTIVIGTFNPGLPDKSKLTLEEQRNFSAIEQTDKFQKFNKVKNFYDRPQNRFWAVMDRILNPDFYIKNGDDAKNKNGLKYYVGSDRTKVFDRQQTFCKKIGLFITDLVTEIKPESFQDIYDNFPDTKIEISNPIWNTDSIINSIKIFKPKKVLINFGTSNNSISKIATQANIIKKEFPKISTSVLSTSGAAGNDYKTLLNEWRQHIYINATINERQKGSS